MGIEVSLFMETTSDDSTGEFELVHALLAQTRAAFMVWPMRVPGTLQAPVDRFRPRWGEGRRMIELALRHDC